MIREVPAELAIDVLGVVADMAVLESVDHRYFVDESELLLLFEDADPISGHIQPIHSLFVHPLRLLIWILLLLLLQYGLNLPAPAFKYLLNQKETSRSGLGPSLHQILVYHPPQHVQFFQMRLINTQIALSFLLLLWAQIKLLQVPTDRIVPHPPHAGVEVVFDAVFGPALEQPPDHRPAGAVSQHSVEYLLLLSRAPLSFANFGVEDVDPPLPALLPAAFLQQLRALGPLLRSVHFGPVDQDRVFLLGSVSPLGRALRVFKLLQALLRTLVVEL